MEFSRSFRGVFREFYRFQGACYPWPVRILGVIFLWVLASCTGGGSGAATGGEGNACYPNGTCNAGLVCELEVCVDTTGTEGGACYPNMSCNAGLECVGDICQPIRQADAGSSPDAGALPDGNTTDGAPIDAMPAMAAVYVHTGQSLFSLNMTNFAPSEIGSFNTPSNDQILDLAMSYTGELYGISSTKLYSVDPATGQATEVASVAGNTNVGLTFLSDGRLVAADKSGGFRSIDTTTGVVTEIGEFGSGYALAGDLLGLANGTLLALSDEGPVGNEDLNNVLISINPDTGAFSSSIGQTGWGRTTGIAEYEQSIFAFTDEGYVIELDPSTGVGAQQAYHPTVPFWGAASPPVGL